MITPEQAIERTKYLGASDVPAILGVDSYRSAADVYLEKTGEAEPFAGNDATNRGNLLEPAILEFARQEIKQPFRVGIMQVHPNLFHAANYDGISDESTFVVEGKSSRVAGDYGEQGTDQVPDKVVVQTHAQMLVAGPQCRIAYVPIITIGLEFRMYVVPRNDALCDDILAAGTEFMRDFVHKRVRPSDFRPSLEVLKRVKRQPKTIIDVPKMLIDDWIVAKAAKKQAEDDAEAAYTNLLAAMKSADACEDETGRFVTYFEQNRIGFTVAPTKFRVMRLQKNVKAIESKPKHAALAAQE